MVCVLMVCVLMGVCFDGCVLMVCVLMGVCLVGYVSRWVCVS